MAIEQRDRGDRSGSKVEGFPYPYNSDLHWLWGWGKRIEEWTESDNWGSCNSDWIVIRPCRLASEAMMTYSIDYQALIAEVSRVQRHVESRWEEVQNNSNEGTVGNYIDSLRVLSSRIFKACELIALREPPVFSGENPTTESVSVDKSALPQVNISGEDSTVNYHGAVMSVAYEAAVLLQELCDSFPVPKGLTNDDRSHPSRIIKKMPISLQEIIETTAKGSVFKV